MDPQLLALMASIFGGISGNQQQTPPVVNPTPLPVNQNLMNNTGANSYVTVDPSWISPATGGNLAYQMETDQNKLSVYNNNIPQGHYLSTDGRIYEDISARNDMGQVGGTSGFDSFQQQQNERFNQRRNAQPLATNPNNTALPATAFTNVNNNNNNTSTNAGVNTLVGGPNLNNRRPSLAAGWGGWDANSSNGPQGSANFTYYSRFS